MKSLISQTPRPSRPARRLPALRLVLGLLAGLSLVAAGRSLQGLAPQGLAKIQHILVIYLENRSFDNLFGMFPGADGLANAGKRAIQVDRDGTPYKILPPVADPRFPPDLPNRPFAIDAYVPPGEATGDLVHRFYQEQQQIDGGRMDKFAAYSNAGALTMGHYDGRAMKLWSYARDYVLADHFFHAAFGGSFLNHFWLICACTPRFDGAPDRMKAVLDRDGRLLKDGAVTPDGYAVNTVLSVFAPHRPGRTDSRRRLPPQTMPTIGDRLSEKGISWAWYAGGWNDALAGRPGRRFQFHHQPFAYFAQFGDGTAARAEHLKDEVDLVEGIARGSLPAVAFWKPAGEDNEHPGYADLMTGDRHVAEMIETLRGSPLWSSTAIIVTYDENGGQWDHVPPPKIDRWGPGTRVPAVIISPFARRGFVDHTIYDTTSILAFIETRFSLKPLGSRDAKAANLTNAFDFSQTAAGKSGGGTGER